MRNHLAVPVQRLRHQATAVGWQAIPEQNHWAAAVTLQGLQEACDLGTPNTSPMQPQQPAEPAAAGVSEHGGDAGQSLPIERLHQLGGLSTRGPGGPDWRALRKAALVQKTQPSLQLFRVFFIRGQRTRTQWAMAASLRSLARRAGCWRLQPSCPSSR